MKQVIARGLLSALGGLTLYPCLSLAQSPVAMPQALARSVPKAECKSNDDWSEPSFARHIYGNSWYVGTCGISVILIATPQGHILIDGATEQAAPDVEASIRSLGVNLSDIKTILVTHEHHDHIGGVAQLQKDSGAVVLTRKAALDALRQGKNSPNDPQFGELKNFPPISNVQAIADGGLIRLGSVKVNNIPMTGHAPGGSGWSWQECENGVCLNLMFSDSISSISNASYRFSSSGAITSKLRASIKRLSNTPCDILITGHGKQSNLLNRLDGKATLSEPKACKELATTGRENLSKRLSEEARSRSR